MPRTPDATATSGEALGPRAAGANGRTPFLSVVTRTQGRRLGPLREAMLSLSAQTDDEFELLVMGHRLTAEQRTAVEELLASTERGLRERTRFIAVERGARPAPLNEGFEHARGEYVAIFDDDDLLFAHWVETFHALARQSPGRVLRAGAVRQTFEPVQPRHSAPTSRAVTGFDRYPMTFDFLEHLVGNRSPCLSLAFPRTAFSELGLRFDETLTTTEDWDFLMRAAMRCGVADSSEVTSIYRIWHRAESSVSVHDPSEWQANIERILSKLDQLPLVLPEGSARRLRELVESSGGGRRLPEGHANALRERAQVILSSRSWKLSAPLRAARRSSGKALPDAPRLWAMDGVELEALVEALEQSASWKLTGHLREAKTQVKTAWKNLKARVRGARGGSE